MENKQGLLYLVPKASYYNTKKEMVEEANRLHDDMLREDRILYTYLLFFQNSTYYSKSLIIERLLSQSLHKEENAGFLKEDAQLLAIEDALIHYALFNENITHALKLLLSLKTKRINNSRATKVVLRFLFERGNLDYISIKYKDKVKELLIHALGQGTLHGVVRREEKAVKKFNKSVAAYKNPFSLETVDFLFGKEKEFHSPFYAEYVKIRNDFKNGTVSLNKQTKLPIEVLEGFNNFYKRGFNIPSLLTAAVVSEKQKIQMQNTVKRQSNNTVEIKVDLSKYSIMDLFKYLYNKQEVTDSEKNEILSFIQLKAQELKDSLAGDFVLDLSQTAILLDASDSNEGSQESKLHPLYKNLTLAEIFSSQDKENLFVTGGDFKEGILYPEGHTDLSTSLLEIVKGGYKNVIVLSDGFENVGSFDKVYRQLKAIGHELNVVHFNPVFSPKNFSFKKISEEVLAIPFTNEKDVSNLALFCLLSTDKETFKKVMREKIVSTLL